MSSNTAHRPAASGDPVVGRGDQHRLFRHRHPQLHRGKPTEDDPRNYTQHSAAVIAVSGRDGAERWVSQISAGDVWNHTMPAYDTRDGTLQGPVGRRHAQDLHHRARTARLLRSSASAARTVGFTFSTPIPGRSWITHRSTSARRSRAPEVDPRTLALPSPIGGLQTGCATDGERVYTNGIDRLPNRALDWPEAEPADRRPGHGDLARHRKEFWRHERPKVEAVGGTAEAPLFRDCGDPVASGIAMANGLLFFTTTVSNRLLGPRRRTGRRSMRFPLGPVFSGPSVSRGRVYVGTGNTLWIPGPIEAYFPKQNTGTLHSFGLPGDDEVSRMGRPRIVQDRSETPGGRINAIAHPVRLSAGPATGPPRRPRRTGSRPRTCRIAARRLSAREPGCRPRCSPSDRAGEGRCRRS